MVLVVLLLCLYVKGCSCCIERLDITGLGQDTTATCDTGAIYSDTLGSYSVPSSLVWTVNLIAPANIQISYPSYDTSAVLWVYTLSGDKLGSFFVASGTTNVWFTNQTTNASFMVREKINYVENLQKVFFSQAVRLQYYANDAVVSYARGWRVAYFNPCVYVPTSTSTQVVTTPCPVGAHFSGGMYFSNMNVYYYIMLPARTTITFSLMSRQTANNNWILTMLDGTTTTAPPIFAYYYSSLNPLLYDYKTGSNQLAVEYSTYYCATPCVLYQQMGNGQNVYWAQWVTQTSCPVGQYSSADSLCAFCSSGEKPINVSLFTADDLCILLGLFGECCSWSTVLLVPVLL